MARDGMTGMSRNARPWGRRQHDEKDPKQHQTMTGAPTTKETAQPAQAVANDKGGGHGGERNDGHMECTTNATTSVKLVA